MLNRFAPMFILAFLSAPLFAQSTPAERAQDLAIRRKAGGSRVSRSEEIYLNNNIHFELSEEGWTGLNLAGDKLLHNMGWWPRSLNEYAKKLGLGDVSRLEYDGNVEAASQAAEALKDKVSIRFKDDGVKWTQEKAGNFINYAGHLVSYLGASEGFTPKSGVYNVTMVFTSKVKDVSVAVNKDGSILVKTPSEYWPPDWDTRMKAGFMKAGSFARYY